MAQIPTVKVYKGERWATINQSDILEFQKNGWELTPPAKAAEPAPDAPAKAAEPALTKAAKAPKAPKAY